MDAVKQKTKVTIGTVTITITAENFSSKAKALIRREIQI